MPGASGQAPACALAPRSPGRTHAKTAVCGLTSPGHCIVKKNLRLFPAHFRRFMQTGPVERRLLGNEAGSLVPTAASSPAPGARPASRRPYLAGSHRPPPLRRRLFLGLWSRAEVRPGHALSNSVRGRGDKGPGPERRDLWGPPGRAGRGREP